MWAEKIVVEELKRGPWLKPAEWVVSEEDVGHVVTKAPRRICYVIGCQWSLDAAKTSDMAMV